MTSSTLIWLTNLTTETLADLVKELKSTGSSYRQHVSTVMRASYSHHYRRVIPALLRALEFRSNNQMHQPVIRALEVIKRTVEHAPRFYDPEEVPLEGMGSHYHWNVMPSTIKCGVRLTDVLWTRLSWDFIRHFFPYTLLLFGEGQAGEWRGGSSVAGRSRHGGDHVVARP